MRRSPTPRAPCCSPFASLALFQGALGNPRRRWLTFGAAAWGLAPLLFWGLKPGNSARHNLPAFPPLVFLAVLDAVPARALPHRRAWILIVMLLLLGQMDLTGNNSVTPRVDVLLATEQVENATSSLHARAREFMNSPNPKKAIIETEYLQSYSEFEAWAAAKTPSLREKRNSQKTIGDGPERETRVLLYRQRQSSQSPGAKFAQPGLRRVLPAVFAIEVLHPCRPGGRRTRLPRT